MYNEYDLLNSIFAVDHLRVEALSLYEQCLANKGTQQMAQFIEQQLTASPPPLMLFERISDDLQQRLFTLQSHHFDVRKYVIETVQAQYKIDITTLTPADQLDHFHAIDPQAILELIPQELSAKERKMLLQMLEISQNIATQLQADIRITAELLQMVLDWAVALSVRLAREESLWHFGIQESFSDEIIQ